MMYEYHAAVSTISVPEGLNARVLAARRKSKTTLLPRLALCAACAAAVLLGSFSLQEEESVPLPSVHYAFGITALASEPTANATVLLPLEGERAYFAVSPPEEGTLTLSADRGDLSAAGDGTYALSPAPGETAESLSGVTVTLTARYADDTSEQKEFVFTAEQMRTYVNEDGSEVLIPALSGDASPLTPVLYAATEESRFLSWPVAGSGTVSLSFPYGKRETPNATLFHSGIDIPGERGLSITAAAAGTVLKAGFDPQQGNSVTLEHSGGLTTVYSHCQELLVSAGQTVAEGDVIALLGSTGMSTGPHLHFEVREQGEARNPIAYFSADIRQTLRMG